MSPLAIVITAEQAERLQEICEASGLSPDSQVGAMIDLEWEEWQDALAPEEPSRSTRFARFAASESVRLCACCSLPESLPDVGPFVERDGEQVCRSCAFNIGGAP